MAPALTFSCLDYLFQQPPKLPAMIQSFHGTVVDLSTVQILLCFALASGLPLPHFLVKEHLRRLTSLVYLFNVTPACQLPFSWVLTHTKLFDLCGFASAVTCAPMPSTHPTPTSLGHLLFIHEGSSQEIVPWLSALSAP